jgi:hypothetical protein
MIGAASAGGWGIGLVDENSSAGSGATALGMAIAAAGVSSAAFGKALRIGAEALRVGEVVAASFSAEKGTSRCTSI